MMSNIAIYIIDYNACLEYLTKYVSKAESISDIARDTFVSVVENLNQTEQICYSEIGDKICRQK